MVDVQIKILGGNLSVPTTTLGHSSIEDDEDLIAEHRVLGEGGYGIVEEVSIVSGQDLTRCVRKRIGRPKQLKAQKQIMTAFAREITVMRQVDHRHCVRFLGSYTDFDYVNILSSPVAEMDLATFLDQPIHGKQREILYRGMGCVCNAIHYLHQNNIRHEDLKPQNVLIYRGDILLTDFGFSLDFSDDSVSTTTGRPSAWTIRYSAPEVLNSEPRNRATDIYSLGCILLEMISGFYGTRLSDLKAQWKHIGNGQSSFARNDEAVAAWFRDRQHDMRKNPAIPEVLHLCSMINMMLSPQRLHRPTAQQIVDRLLDISILVPKLSQKFATTCIGSMPCVGLSNSRATEEAMCPSADRLRDSEQLASYLYPWNYETYMYELLDLDLKSIYLKDSTTISVYRRNNYHLQTACDQIYEKACRTGATEKFWKVHQRRENQLQTEDGKEHAQLSANMLSTKHVVFQRIAIAFLMPRPLPVGVNAVDWRLAQITLLPICLARSPYYGSFFWMISWPPYEFLGEGTTDRSIIDLTITR
jgi:serine/threonine protein kinase